MKPLLSLVSLLVPTCYATEILKSTKETPKRPGPSPNHRNASLYRDAKPTLPRSAIELEGLDREEQCSCMVDVLIGGSCDKSLCAISSSFDCSCSTPDAGSDCNSDISRCADEHDECPSFSCSRGGAIGKPPALIFALCRRNQAACGSGCIPLNSVCCGGAGYCDAGYHCPDGTSDGQCVRDEDSDYWLPTRIVTGNTSSTRGGDKLADSSPAEETALSNTTKRTYAPPTGTPVNLNQGRGTVVPRIGWGSWAETCGWLGLSVVVMAWL